MNTPLKIAIGFNHVAYRCRDAEQTRWFYEDVLGLPLAMALVQEEVPGLGDRIPFMHLFFELGNGEYLAFFDQPETAEPEQFQRVHSFDRHVALEVENEAQLLAWQQQINSRGVSCLGPVDHDFVKSVYMYDPNGLQVELTIRTEKFNSIAADERAKAHDVLKTWNERMHQLKLEKFGTQVLDPRANRSKGAAL